MSDDNKNIERDVGTIVGGYRVGGGYRGKREDQDAAVVEFAERLDEMFSHDVTIRYNTNRLGGGAWLVDGKRDAQVGLGAELKPPESHKEKFKAYLNGERDERPTSPKYMDPDELNLVYTVHLAVPSVAEEKADRESAFEGENDYTHRTFDSMDVAWSWFTDNVERDGVNPPADD